MMLSVRDSYKLQVRGKGKVKILQKHGKHEYTNVYYVTDMKINMLSIGQLLERGIYYTLRIAF